MSSSTTDVAARLHDGFGTDGWGNVHICQYLGRIVGCSQTGTTVVL